MEQKRLFLAIAISLAILVGFQELFHRVAPLPHPGHTVTRQMAVTAPIPSRTVGVPPSDVGTVPVPPPRAVPRLPISAPQVQGSVSLLGARLDDLVLRDYHETTKKDSPLVRLLEPLSDPQPYYVEYGWTADPQAAGQAGVKLPGGDTLWTASAPALTPEQPVTLSWNNGEGLTFRIALTIDDHYMFGVRQSVVNASGAPVSLHPYARIRRDYTPETAGYYILHEGLIGVLDGRLQEITYKKAQSAGAKDEGVAFDSTGHGGWAGITDKYWLTALVPDQQIVANTSFRDLKVKSGTGYQVGSIAEAAEVVAPGATASVTSHLFAGAKVVGLLDRYGTEYNIPSFWKAVDFGWFWFLTKPFFFALDWLNGVFGNFGLAILAFTVIVKVLFFPLANKSYKSMSKMKLLGPKIQAMRAEHKEDPARMQQEMMRIYKTEGVNPASGCLPMLIQVPVFFSLYKVIFTTIEMRHAPFFGWIHDLSAEDPTNLFTLFGLVPWDPTHISPFLHMGAWPIIMGITMYMQQRLNPPPPDPMQARMFQFMPVIFTFMLARFPAGLVIYYSWNNLLSIGQQWLIQRQTRLTRPRLAKTST